MRQTVDRCDELIRRSDGFHQHVVVNAAKLVAMQDDPRLRDIIQRCSMINADGQSVVWASKILGDPLPTRVAGIDLMDELLALAAERGYSVYVLGAERDVLETAIRRMREYYPGLVVAGYRDGYFADDESDAVCRQIRASGAQILFVAMSSPRKEYWLAEWGPRLGVPFGMGVGGAIDVVAGKTARAPRPLQRAGLEWAYRLLQEPRRLAGRYLVSNLRFGRMVTRELAGRFTGRA